MERQTKHRILGILVVTGLVIILLPLFQTGKEMTTEATLVKAPPFPDQSVQVVAINPEAGPIGTEPTTNTLSPPVNSMVNQEPADVITATHPSVVNAVTPAVSMDTRDDTLATTDATEPTGYRIIEGDKAESLLKKVDRLNGSSRSAKAQSISTPKSSTIKTAMNTRIDDDGLIKLKSAVWVIQIGSFKSKTNALQLVNQLRANGYKAFIQQMSSDAGEENIRVFVGPEDKRTTAHALADRLQSEMHLQGIVISYKPLTL